MAVGTRLSVRWTWPASTRILAAEFADLAQTGGFGFGSGWASLLQAHAAWLRGRTGEALEATEQACAALAANRLYDGTAHAARAHVAALRGDAGHRRRVDGRRRPGRRHLRRAVLSRGGPRRGRGPPRAPGTWRAPYG